MENLNTLVALRQLYTFWKILCVLPWSNFKNLSNMWLGIIFFMNITYIIGLMFDFILCESWEHVLQNSPFYFGVPVDTAKFFLIFFMRQKLWELKDLFNLLDESITSEDDRTFMRITIKKAQRLFIAYNLITWTSAYTRIVTSIQSHGEIPLLPMWFPFEGKLVVFFYQFSCWHFLALQNGSSDMYAPCFFVLLNSHLRILTRRMSKVGNGSKKNDKCYLDLVACIESHLIILRIHNILKDIISKTFLIQIVIISISICVNILSIATLNLPHGEIIFLLSYSYFSRKFADAAYGTDWVYQNQNFRVAILLMIQKSQNPDPILAGGIIPILLPTFLSVIRLAYSVSALFINQFY
ncbi:odorant receptor 33a-like isoform X2 [Hermetia illucens]|uniref:odorant receptor 33a-like isoform X2 n=1 Tax=Hermetia illucens TaxID=343691 RepID=UPI0018CC4241|nr:odorant receptor 33a-like isoform X2 [Hermetia illucens]